MRDILTGLAIILLLCLTGALIAPHFISWTNHREQVSAYLTEAIGQPVEVRGAIGITLFPSPSLKLGNVVLTGEGGISGDIGRLRLVGSIPPLLRGELKIISANLDHARLIIRPEQIKPTSNSQNNPLDAISIEKLTITHSSVSVQKSDGSTFLLGQSIDGGIEATSLVGPFRGGITYKQDDQIRTLRFSTGRIDNGLVRIKALIENESAAARSEFDGQLAFSEGQVSGEGSVTASGNATLPMVTASIDAAVPQMIWRMTSKAKGNRREIAFNDIEMTLGQDDRQAVFTGNGSMDFNLPEPSKFTFVTRQVDVDRLFGDDSKQLPRAPETLVQLIIGNAGKSITIPWLSGVVDVAAGSLILGRGIIIGPRIIVAVREGISEIKHISAELPGQTTVLVENLNKLQDGAKAQTVKSVFTGNLSLESKDFPKLSSWFHGIPIRATAAKSLHMKGSIFQSNNSISITEATIFADGLNMTGEVNLLLTAPRMKLELKVNADQLDIARLPTVSDFDGPDSIDFDVQFNAQRVQISGVGAGSIHVKARREDGSVMIDAFNIKDLGGASMQASGAIGKAGSKLNGEMNATNLDGLLQLASRLSSHSMISALANRAPTLVPARVAFSFSPDSSDVRTPTARLEVNGRLNDTEIKGFIRLNDAGDLLPGEAIDLSVFSGTPAHVLRQLGLEAIKLDHAGQLRLRLLAHGFLPHTQEAPWSIKGDIAQLEVDITAHRSKDFTQPVAGVMSLKSLDIAPLAQTMLIAVPAVAPGQPLLLTTNFDLRGFKITLRELEARSGHGFVRGELAFNLAEFGRIAGQLQTSELDVQSFAPLIAGANMRDSLSGSWSSQVFGRVAPVTLPGDLWINAEAVRLNESLSVENARFVLRFENGLIYLEYAEAEALGAKLKGAATFRRMDKSVSVTGKVNLTDGSFGDKSRQMAMQGKFDGDIDFSAFADSPAKLVASLSGIGRARLREAELNGVKHGVLAEAVQSSLTSFDPTLYESLEKRLKTDFNGKTSLPTVQIPLALTGGILKAGPIPISSLDEELASTIAVDLKNFSLFNETIIRLRDAPKLWEGAAPSASIIWKGPITQPSMSVEATSLANSLTALAITRETARIDSLEQDQRERSLFNRRLQTSQEEQQLLATERSRLIEAKRQQTARRQADELARQRASVPAFVPTRPSTLFPPLVITPPAAR